MNNQHQSTWQRWGRTALAMILGIIAAVCVHYVIYRLSLPSTPFIYVAF